MNIWLGMKNPVFTPPEIYKMVRWSQIAYFPNNTADIGAAEVLTIFFNKEISILDFKIENIDSEKGLTFSGKSYEIYKDMYKEEAGSEHSPAWYASQVSKWNKETLHHLNEDLNAMRVWLEVNDYVKNGLPTAKFMREEFLVIADVAADRRKSYN